MTARPGTSPLLATDATLGSGTEAALSPRLDPGAGIRARGLLPNTRVPARWVNFFLGLLGDWASYLDQKHQYAHNVLNFGADPTSGAASDAAFAAAQSASVATGGKIIVPPGTYHFDDSLHPIPGTSWRGEPGRTTLQINHASKPLLAFDSGSGFFGTSHKSFSIFSGFSFGALVANTGASIYNSGNNFVRAKFQNCTWNDPDISLPLLNGKLALIQGSDSVFSFEDCYLRSTGDAHGLQLTGANAAIRITDSRLVMPATYTSRLVQIENGSLYAQGNVFDTTDHTGSADLIFLSNGEWHVLRDNTFLGDLGSGQCIRTSVAGVSLSETGSVFDSVNLYDLAGRLTDGSELTLGRALTTDAGASVVAVTCATGYRGESFKFTAGAPTITLPTPLYVGQPFDLTVYNLSGGPWGFSLANYGTKASQPATVANNQGASARFVAGDPKLTGTLEWHQIGDWALTAP